MSVLAMEVANPETQTSPWSQFPGSPAGKARHDDIYFVDENTGWSVRAAGLIHKTTDGGNTWALKLTKTGTHFRCIGFASPSRGFAGNLGVGSYDAAVTDSNVLYQTFDGGDTWENVLGFAEEGMKGLCAMYILDANHVYGGGRVRGPAYFIKSTDGGANWTIRNLTAMGVMNGIMDIYFQDPLNGFVVGMDPNKFSADCSPPYYGRLAKTTDGGETWTPVLTTDISCGYLWKMSWPTPQTGYVSMQQNGSYSKIAYYKTTDGGNNWVLNEIPLSSLGLGPSSFYLQGIGFVSPDEGWVGGTAGIPYPSSFLHTSDGGDTWSKSGYNNTYRINRIRFLNSGFGVAAGERLHVFRPSPFPPPPPPPVPPSKINATVGQWEKGAVNTPADVSTVQRLLQTAAQQLNDPSLDPKGIDGKIARVAAKSNTVLAIQTFQTRSALEVTGLIEPADETWTKLLAAAGET